MAIAFGIRQWAMSWVYSEKSRADNATTQENVRADANAALIDIAKQGNVFQQKMIQVVEENTRASEKSAAETRGMITMMDGFGSVLKNAVIGMDETHVNISSVKSDQTAIKNAISTLPTELGDSINTTIGPIVDELKNIGVQVRGVASEITTRDIQLNERLTTLIDRFQRAETWLMRTLEPIVIAQMKELLPPDTPSTEANHKEDTKETQS